MRLLFASTLSTLTACAPSSEYVAPQLPAVTDRLALCTDEPVPAIPGEPGTPLRKAEVAGVIGDQRTSALAKDRCAHDWRDFYSALRKGIGGADGGKP